MSLIFLFHESLARSAVTHSGGTNPAIICHMIAKITINITNKYKLKNE
jgi:hypothetical protein